MDPVAWSFAIEVIGVDGALMHALTVRIHASTALSVDGAINDADLACDILDNAADAIRGYHQRKGGLVVPGKDVSIRGRAVRQVNVTGPIENRTYALGVMASAKAAIRDMHARRALKPITASGAAVEI